MKPIDQRGANDCLRACIASIFEIAYEDAPDCAIPLGISDQDRAFSQHNIVNEWLKARDLVECQLDDSGPAPVLRRGMHVSKGDTSEPCPHGHDQPVR